MEADLDDLIIGPHSIFFALKNTLRKKNILYSTKESSEKFFNAYPELKNKKNFILKQLSNDEFINISQANFNKRGFQWQRIPGQLLLISSTLPQKSLEMFLEEKKGYLKIIALDQVSDVQNGAAILRTAAFFGVDALIIEKKGNFGLTPGSFRLASGAFEIVPIIFVNQLTKAISKLKDFEVTCIGFSEKAKSNIDQFRENASNQRNSLCLFFGEEEKGLSFSIQRTMDHLLAYESRSEIKSLNVSVAAAVAMKDFFS